MNNWKVALTVSAAVALGASQAWAGPLTVPNTFTSGSTISSADMNANFDEIETQVTNNDGRITTNAAGIATNAGNISTNTTNITTNTGNIATNAAGIAANTAAITTNTGNIATNAAGITANSAAIATNTTNIATNTTAIAALSSPSCPSDMVAVGNFCIDTYEASVVDRSLAPATGASCSETGNDCSNKDNTGADSANAIFAQSVAGVAPVASITWFQAAQACANVGKRLPTNQEWQIAAAGTSAASCNISSASVANTDANPSCISNWGAVNMIGNVSEWVADWMAGSGGVTTPPESVAQGATWGDDRVDDVRAATFQASTGTSNLPAAMVRGGDNNDGTGAGVFALDVTTAPTNAGNTRRGFRCAKTL